MSKEFINAVVKMKRLEESQSMFIYFDGLAFK